MLTIHRAQWAQRQANIAGFIAAVGFRAEADTEERLADIRTKQERLLARSQQILDAAEAFGRKLTSEECQAIQRRTQEIERLEEDAERLEAELRQPQARRTAANAGESLHATAGDPMTRNRSRDPARAFAADPPRAFASMFPGQMADPYGGAFESFGQFAAAVAAGNDSRLIRPRAYNSSTTAEGASAGYLVPTGFVQSLMDAALQREVFRPRANVIPVPSGNSVVAGFESTDRTGAKRAGLQLSWGSEAQALTEQKPKAVEMLARAVKASIFCRISNELMSDAPNFDAQLSQAMTAATAAGLDLVFLAGTGAGQPLGVINAPATITVTKESGQAANTLLLQNLAKMVGRLSPECFARSVWYVHPTLVPTLYLMSYTVKNVAGTENVGGSAVQAVSHDGAGNLLIFGRPALVTDACSPLSTKGDIVLADPMRYLITMRGDVRLARDTSVFFDSDEIAFRLTMRLDGMPSDAVPTKLRDGTNTVSPFVVLESR